MVVRDFNSQRKQLKWSLQCQRVLSCPNTLSSHRSSLRSWRNISRPVKICLSELLMSWQHSTSAAPIWTPISSTSEETSPIAPFPGSLAPLQPGPPFTISILRLRISASAVLHVCHCFSVLLTIQFDLTF
jgi:hypothetical protein